MRPIPLGRKNWLHAGSDAGGERAAAIFSLTETAKLNSLDPEDYLRQVLERSKRVGTNTLRRGAGVCWTWDMDMPDLPVIGKRCSRPGTPTR